MSRRITIRSIMILVAVLALTLGVFESVRGRTARIAAARIARQKAHEAKYMTLSERHGRDWATWQARFRAFGEVDRRTFMAIEHWKKEAKVRDAGEIAARKFADFADWAHPDSDDTFPVLRGPSDGWEARLKAHEALTRQCLARANFHQRQQGLCYNAAHAPIEAGVFAKEIAEAPPAVDPYPAAYLDELAGKPPRRPTVEPIPIGQLGL